MSAAQFELEAKSWRRALVAVEELIRLESSLLDTRMFALRQTTDFHDDEAVMTTEGLGKRVASWKVEATDAIRALLDCLFVVDNTATAMTAARSAPATDRTIEETMVHLQSEIDMARAESAEGFENAVMASFASDSVFKYLLEKTRRAETSPKQGLSVGDRWLSKLIDFEKSRASYFEAMKFPEELKLWTATAVAEVSRLKKRIEAADEARAEAVSEAEAGSALFAGATLTAERALHALLELTGAYSSVFERLDTDISCAIARETAAACVRVDLTTPSDDMAISDGEQEHYIRQIGEAHTQIDDWIRDHDALTA